MHMYAFRVLLSVVFGLLFGFSAGLIGVGGGEFRIPILMCFENYIGFNTYTGNC